MKIWRASGTNACHGSVHVWEASERKVRALYINNFFGEKPDDVVQIEIPTDKGGLIDWLNNHFTTDNG